MPLFVVRHSHQGERCPAQDPYMGAMLLNHLSRPNVRRHGVEILGEAVVQGEHTMFLIAEASDENHLREFLQPFQMAGSVDVFPASTCARVVASGGCGAPLRPPTRPPCWTRKRSASLPSMPGSWCTACTRSTARRR